jgi:PEP-CTERM motif
MPSLIRATLGVISVLLITAITAITAEAGQVTVNFTATVTSVDSSVISGTAIGDLFTGTLVYDSSVPVDTPGANPAVYTTLPPLPSPIGISVTVGGNTFGRVSNSVLQVQVGNDLPGTFPDVFTAVSLVDVNGTSKFASFGVADTTGTVFSSTALPTSLDLSKFTNGVFQIGTSTSGVILTGDIHVGSVPEPSSFMLLAIGILGSGIWARRRFARG